MGLCTVRHFQDNLVCWKDSVNSDFSFSRFVQDKDSTFHSNQKSPAINAMYVTFPKSPSAFQSLYALFRPFLLLIKSIREIHLITIQKRPQHLDSPRAVFRVAEAVVLFSNLRRVAHTVEFASWRHFEVEAEEESGSELWCSGGIAGQMAPEMLADTVAAVLWERLMSLVNILRCLIGYSSLSSATQYSSDCFRPRQSEKSITSKSVNCRIVTSFQGMYDALVNSSPLKDPPFAL